MNKSFFKNNKFSIEFIMLLLSVIILSVLIYIGIKYEKGYVKNFEYEFEEYNYEKNIFHSKEGNIRLIDSRSFNGIVTDVKMLDYGALATYKNKSNKECGIRKILLEILRDLTLIKILYTISLLYHHLKIY